MTVTEMTKILEKYVHPYSSEARRRAEIASIISALDHFPPQVKEDVIEGIEYASKLYGVDNIDIMRMNSYLDAGLPSYDVLRYSYQETVDKYEEFKEQFDYDEMPPSIMVVIKVDESILHPTDVKIRGNYFTIMISQGRRDGKRVYNVRYIFRRNIFTYAEFLEEYVHPHVSSTSMIPNIAIGKYICLGDSPLNGIEAYINNIEIDSEHDFIAVRGAIPNIKSFLTEIYLGSVYIDPSNLFINIRNITNQNLRYVIPLMIEDDIVRKVIKDIDGNVVHADILETYAVSNFGCKYSKGEYIPIGTKYKGELVDVIDVLRGKQVPADKIDVDDNGVITVYPVIPFVFKGIELPIEIIPNDEIEAKKQLVNPEVVGLTRFLSELILTLKQIEEETK